MGKTVSLADETVSTPILLFPANLSTWVITCPINDDASHLPPCLQTWKWRGRLSGSSLHYLYSISCYHMGGKFHGNLFFHFVFLLFPVFRHYVATAIITHRYKYLPLPLLVDLQIFSVSTPFSNTILCETSIYKTDKGTLCEYSVC